MNDYVVGTSAYSHADKGLLREAHIGFVRQGFPFPFTDRHDGTLSEGYKEARAKAQNWVEQGFKIMGITPLLGFERPDAVPRVWKVHSPDWMGDQLSERFFENYRDTCSFLAKDLRGLVSMWQIGNEWNARAFCGPLGMRRGCDLVFYGAQGLKSSDPSVLAGTNGGGITTAYYLFGRLFNDTRRDLLDYCGVDQYFGTHRAGGPESWDAMIEELADITQSRILINEWGYSSAGELMNDAERERAWGGAYYRSCMIHKWPYAWGGGHTPEVQAEYIRQTLRVFSKHRGKLIGMFFYRWEDQQKCWCGLSDCPCETRWGLVDLAGTLKPGFYAFKEGVQQLGL
jgi:hypothetical protein